MKAENYDVVIIGSGVAALICALTLDDSINICLITKKKLRDSNSYLAQGGISVCRGKEDREDYIEDTLIAGHYKNDRKAVEILVDESEEAVKTLIEMGVKFTGDKKGLFYTREGGHRKFRILYCEDRTGKYIMESLIKKVLEKKNIKTIENCEFLDIVEENNTCLGIVAKNKEIFSIRSKFTVLATGGIGGIYKNTTNFSHIRGDGIATAIRHNIELKDISYVQIHPTTFYTKDNERKFLISESVRGEGAVLLNQKLQRFTDELKPRDEVTRAILEEMKKDKSEYEWLDFSTIKLDIEKRFPNIYKQLIKKDINVLKDKVPVVPAQHYTMGGIKVNMDSKTSMKNLYAVGEVACTGVHGQNRLASNSLLESVVFGKRAAHSINVENNVSNYNNVTADNAFKNIEKEVFEIENKIKENKNIIEQRIKEDEFEKNR